VKSAPLPFGTGARQLNLTDRDIGDIERLLLLLGARSRGSESGPCHEPDLRTLALRIHSARALRPNYLPSAMFGETAWDILLAVYGLGDGVAGLDMICEGALMRTNSALRWLDYLEEERLVAREDWQRGPVVRLTDMGREALESYLARLGRQHF
jgi:hypothetical protein